MIVTGHDITATGESSLHGTRDSGKGVEVGIKNRAKADRIIKQRSLDSMKM